MSSKIKKQAGSVKANPLAGGPFFDLLGPLKPASQPVPPPLIPVLEGHEKKTELLRFALIGFVLFLLLSVGSVYSRGSAWMSAGKAVAYAGYDRLQQGMTSLREKDFGKAHEAFLGAASQFEALQDSVSALTSQATQFSDSPLYLGTLDRLVASGTLIASMADRVTGFLERAEALPEKLVAKNREGDAAFRLTDRIREEKAVLDSLLKDAATLNGNLSELYTPLLPQEFRARLAGGRATLDQFITGLSELQRNFGTVLTLLGDRVPHRYLVLLENRNELRATGGFIGSYALVTLDDGLMTRLEIKDVYSSDGQLADVVPAPAGIDQVADRLYMRDANYSPDFPTSAQAIMWFLEHSRGPSVDTVVAIDQSVAEKLLALTGPVKVPHFPIAITAENFSALFSYVIESKLSQTGVAAAESEAPSPKQLLMQFIPVFKDKLLALDDFRQAETALQTLIAEKHVQVYSTEDDVEALARQLNMAGEMTKPAPETDFLALVTTAIGGNKSDAYVETALHHHTAVQQNGSLQDTLEITKKHTWSESEMAKYEPWIREWGLGQVSRETLAFILGAGENVDYLRVYVPKGSVLERVEGYPLKRVKTSEDLGYTVFALRYGPLRAGKSKTVTLHYTLPYRLSATPLDHYRLIVQKQAGAKPLTLEKTLATAEGLEVAQQYPAGTKKDLARNQIFVSSIRNWLD